MTRTLVFLSIMLAAKLAVAQAQGQDQGIRVTPSGMELYRLAVVGSEGIAPIVANDLDLTGYFKILDPKSFPQALTNEPLESLNTSNWMQVGALGVSKCVGSGEMRCAYFDLGKGDRPQLSKRYSGMAPRQAAHAWADELVRYLTGEDTFFGTEIIFAGGSRRGREIHAMDFDGGNARQVTKMSSMSMLPNWGASGREIFFLSFLFGAPDVWTVPANGGRARRLTKSGNALSGVAVSPDGKMAVTLTRDGNPDIYLLRADGSIGKRLTDSPAIDTSPTFSPDGSQIAFVSNRVGNPHIFVMNADGSGVRRLTYQGTYNQTPRWCPRKDMPLIAFTARDERLRFDIFAVDAKSGQVQRLTQDQGNNEEPTWAPNCRAIAYESSRGGIFVLNPNTRVEHQIYKGDAQSPRWGPAARRR